MRKRIADAICFHIYMKGLESNKDIELSVVRQHVTSIEPPADVSS
jgi:hypothetical protein